jgi:hypothetical protein
VTLSPLATPKPQNIQFAGVIERLPPIRLRPWVLGGQMVIVAAHTQVEGTPAMGLRAEVEAVQHTNTVAQAIKITIKR